MLIPSARGRGGKEKGEDYDYVAITIREYSYKYQLLRPGYGRDSRSQIYFFGT